MDTYLTSDKTCGMTTQGSPLSLGIFLSYLGGGLFRYPGVSLISRVGYISYNSQGSIFHHVQVLTWELNNKWNLCTLLQWGLQVEVWMPSQWCLSHLTSIKPSKYVKNKVFVPPMESQGKDLQIWKLLQCRFLGKWTLCPEMEWKCYHKNSYF